MTQMPAEGRDVQSGVGEKGTPSDKEKENEKDDCPDGGYGWVVMICLVGINAVTWGTFFVLCS